MKKQMPIVYGVVDLGSSLFKGLFSLEGFLSIEEKLSGAEKASLEFVEMGPAVIRVQPTALEEYRGDSDFERDPKNFAFISMEGQYYAIGQLAEDRFSATPALGERKVTNAPQRLMAGVWVAAEKLGLEKGTFDLHLKCLLPPAEYADRDKLKTLLEKAMKNFDTPSGIFKTNLKEFSCKPEGYGMVKGHVALRQKEKAAIGDRVIGVLSLGHRDCSVFKLEKGHIKSPKGRSKAFAEVIDQIKGEVSSICTKEKMTQWVALYLATGLDKYLLELEKGDEYRDKLKESIQGAKEQFLEALFLWLSQELRDIDDVIVGGGTAQLFKKEIAEYFSTRLPNYPGATGKAIFLNGKLEIPDNSKIPKELRARFIDVYFL